MDENKTVIIKESKNRISVDYEGKASFKVRMLRKLKATNTWSKAFLGFFKFILMLGVSYVILFPFVSKVAGSFMSINDIADATVSLIPREPTVEIYKYLILDNGYFKALGNTVLLSLMCAAVQTFVSCLIGYGLAKFKFKGNKLMFVLVVVIMLIPHTALEQAMIIYFESFDLLIPVSFDNGLSGIFELIGGERANLKDTFIPYLVMSLGGLAFKNGLYIYLMRQFFKGVPDELEESAYVDGAGTFRTFLQIIIPLSVPMMITVFLFSFSWTWTDVFYEGIFSFESETSTMPSLLSTFFEKTPENLDILYKEHAAFSTYKTVINNTAGIMIILPLVILYLFCQRYLVQGIERSGLVG